MKYRDLRILWVHEILDLELCKIGYRLLNNDLPKKLLTCISTNETSKSLKKTHDYHTWQKDLVNLPKVQNNKYSKSFLCATIRHIQPLLFITKDSYNLRHFVFKYKKRLFATGNNWKLYKVTVYNTGQSVTVYNICSLWSYGYSSMFNIYHNWLQSATLQLLPLPTSHYNSYLLSGLCSCTGLVSWFQSMKKLRIFCSSVL